MYEPQLEAIDLLKKRNHREVKQPLQQQVQLILEQAESKTEENEALLLLLDTIAHKLDSPINVVIDCSELLLARVDPCSPLAGDLKVIVEQTRYINEIIRGFNYLTDYEAISQTGPVN
jgi:signal transduction histidine kinase